MSNPDMSETAAWLNIHGDLPCLLPDDDTAVERLMAAEVRAARMPQFTCAVAHYDADGYPTSCPDAPRQRWERLVAALREGLDRKVGES